MRTATALFFTTLLPALALLIASTLSSGAAQDRVTFGGDIVVAVGETVDSVVTLGGEALILGTVRGDVVTMGGDVDVRSTGEVRGSVASMGGDVVVSPGGTVRGETNSLGGDIIMSGEGRSDAEIPILSSVPSPASTFLGLLEDAVEHVISYILLFILGLFLIGALRERFDGVQVSLIRRPWPSLGAGLLSFLVVAAGLLILVVSVIGIPAAVVLGLAAPLVVYVGLAAAAAVIGAALPLTALSGRPVMQLGSGVLVLFIVSLLPFLGGLAVFAAAAFGTGALVLSRFQPTHKLTFGGL